MNLKLLYVLSDCIQGKLPIQVNVSVPQVKQESSTLRSVATPNNKLSPNSSSPPPLPPRWESDSEGKV